MILVTGGRGYIGARIASDLLISGKNVRLGTTRSAVDIASPLDACEIAPIDLTDSATLESACDGIDIIVHLAAMNAQSCAEKPEEALIINGLGTLKLITAAKKMGVRNFIYFSTAHVYGAPLQGYIDENTVPKPSHPYAITHRIAEDYVYEASIDGSICGTVFRLSNAVGSPVFYDTNCWMLAVNDLARQVVMNKVMRFHSVETVQRDYLSLSDVGNAVMQLVEMDKGSSFELFNLGSGKSLTLRQLADLIARASDDVFGYYPEILFSDVQDGGSIFSPSPSLSYSNNKLIQAGFELEYDLINEIKALLLNCKKWCG